MSLHRTRKLHDRTLIAYSYNNILILEDSNGTTYDAEKYLSSNAMEDAIELFFEEEANNDAGFNLDVNETSVSDNFYSFLKSRADVGRSIIIETFGNKYAKFKNYPHRKFNALVINSRKPKNVDLKKARGTDIEVQKCVESGTRFEEVMSNMVTVIERENLNIVGIYCRAGHHRSVACAELLKQHIYKDANINHLTIK